LKPKYSALTGVCQ